MTTSKTYTATYISPTIARRGEPNSTVISHGQTVEITRIDRAGIVTVRFPQADGHILTLTGLRTRDLG